MPKLKEVLFGKKEKKKVLPTLSPGQMELMSLITEGLKTGQGPLKDILGQFNMEEFQKGVSQPALKQFEEQIMPQLQEKFIGRNQALSSGFQNAATKAGADLQSQLASLLYQAQQSQKQNRLSGLGSALGTRTIENVIRGGTEGLIPGMAKGFAQGAGNAAGAAIAG